MATQFHEPTPHSPILNHDEALVAALHERFGYTQDNNRDVIEDDSMTMKDALEEIAVRAAYEYLLAYLARDTSFDWAGCVLAYQNER